MHIEKQGTSAVDSAIAKSIMEQLTSAPARRELSVGEPVLFDLQNHTIPSTLPVTFTGQLSVDTTAGSSETVILNVDCRETAGAGGFFSVETTWALGSSAVNGTCTVSISQ